MDSSPTIPEDGLDISRIVDGLFWGAILAIGLLGITTVQGWTYATQNSDRWWMRLLVITLVLLDVVTGILGILLIYNDLVLHFGSVSNLQRFPRFVLVDLVLTMLMVFIVQIFFATRVHFLNPRSHFLPVVIVGCAIASLVCGLLIPICGFDYFDTIVLGFRRGFPNKVPGGLMAGFSLIVDILTTLSLSRTFNSAASIISQTKTILDKLLFYSITRGVLLAVAQTAALGLTVTAHPLYDSNWTTSYLIMSKLYVITMLSMLNSRDSHSRSTSTNTVHVVEFAEPPSLPKSYSEEEGRHPNSSSPV